MDMSGNLLMLAYRIYRRNPKFFLINVSSFAIVGLIISLIIPKLYLSTGSFMPPMDSADNVSGLLTMTSALTKAAGGLGGIGKSVGLPGALQEADVYAAICESRTVREIVIKKCNLYYEYKLDKIALKDTLKAMEKAVKELKKNTLIDVTPENIVKLSAISKDPNKSADIVNAYIWALDEYNKMSSRTRSKKVREFLEYRIAKHLKELKDAEDSLEVFQSRHKTISLTDEMKEAIKTAAVLEANMMSNQVKIEAMSNYMNESNPELITLKNENVAIKSRLTDFKTGKSDLFVPFRSAPSIGMELTRRWRTVRILEELYSILLMQYEQAKVNEARDAPTIQVLDYGKVPVKKYKPKRAIIVIASLILGAFMSFMLLFIADYRKTLKHNSNTLN